MFPLSNGKLIRLNNDGTNGEIIHSKKTKMIFGTKILHDHFIKDIDPEKDVSCEISRDEYGRVSIANKSKNEIFVNGKSVTSIRPLFNNSIIKICDDVEFKWEFKPAKENISGEENDADFPSWSDPAKKNMKQSRIHRPKGRLTAHPLNFYSTACEDVADKDDDNSTGCSVIPQLNDSVFTTQPVDVQNAAPQLVNVSQELMNFDESQIDVASDTTENHNVTMNKTVPDNLMRFDVRSVEPENRVSLMKAQASDCSVITISSDGSQETITQENHDKSVEMEIDELFEKSITSPPSEPPDELFETSDDENSNTANSADLIKANENQCIDTTDEATIKTEELCIKEQTAEKPSQRSSIGVESTQQTNTSIEQSSSNYVEFVIPETQDVFSEDNENEANTADASGFEKTEYSIITNISINQSHPNMSIISLSSVEEQDISQVQQLNDNNTVMNSENLFETEVDEIHPCNIDIKTDISTSYNGTKTNTDLKEKAPVEQSNSLNESETIFSQSLNNDFNESTTETKSETLNEQSEHMVDENEQLQEQQFQEQPFASTTENEHQQDETIDIVFHGANASLLSELKSKQPEDNRVCQGNQINSRVDDIVSANESLVQSTGTMPTDVSSILKNGDIFITSSHLSDQTKTETEECIPDTNECEAVPISISSNITDTTEDAQSDIDFDSDDTMDTLEFESTGSSDSGNITASCANTTPETSQISNSVKSSTDVSMTENHLAQTSSKMDNRNIDPEIVSDKLNEIEPNVSLADQFMSGPVYDEPIVNSEVLSNQNDSSSVCCNTTQNHDDIATFATPAKGMASTYLNLSVKRSTRRTRLNAENDSARKFDGSLTQGTLSQLQTPSKINDQSEIIPETQITPNNESVIVRDIQINPESTNVSQDGNITMESPQSNDDVVASTPAKMLIKSDDIGSSTVTRSTRRNVKIVGTEPVTPKPTPRKLNVSLAVGTPIKVEEPEIQAQAQEEEVKMTPPENEPTEVEEEKISNVYAAGDSTQVENDVAKMLTPARVDLIKNPMKCDSAVTRSTRRKQPIQQIDCIATPIRTPRKRNVTILTNTSGSDQNEGVTVKVEQTDENTEIASVEMSENRESTQNVDSSTGEHIENVEQISQNEQTLNELLETSIDTAKPFVTPAKVVVKSEKESRVSTPSTRCEQPHFEVESSTPKPTLRQLNVSMATPCKTETISPQMPTRSVIVKEESGSAPLNNESADEQIQSIADSPESHEKVAISATPAIVVSIDSNNLSIVRSTERKQQTESKPKQIPLGERFENVTVKNEQPDDCDESPVLSSTESNEVSDEIVESSEGVEEIVFATPGRAKVITKSGCKSASTRSSIRNRPIPQIDCLATPKRMPKEVKVGLTSATPRPMERVDDEPQEDSIQENIENVSTNENITSMNEEYSNEELNISIKVESIQMNNEQSVELESTEFVTNQPETSQFVENTDSNDVQSELVQSTQCDAVSDFVTPAKAKLFSKLGTPMCDSSKVSTGLTSATPQESTAEIEDAIQENIEIDENITSMDEYKLNVEPTQINDDQIAESQSIKLAIESIPTSFTDSNKTAVPEIEMNASKISDTSQPIANIESPTLSTESNEALDDIVESSQGDEVTVSATPAKAKLIAKLGNSCKSAVTRSSLRIRPILQLDCLATPKRDLNNVNIGLSLATPQVKNPKVEAQEERIPESIETVPADESITSVVADQLNKEAIDSVVDETEQTSEVQHMESESTEEDTEECSTSFSQSNVENEMATPESTPKKLNASNMLETPPSSLVESERFENLETSSTPVETPKKPEMNSKASENMEPDTNETIEHQNIEPTQKDNKLDVITPPKMLSKSTENCKSAILVRSSRRKQPISKIDCLATPKRPPRKLNAVLTSTEKMDQTSSTPESNENKPIQETPDEQAQETVELVSVQGSETLPENDKSSDVEENVEPNQAVLSTPSKSEMVKKLTDNSKSVVIRSSKRKQPVSQIDCLATPHRVTRKLMVGCVITSLKIEETNETPCKSDKSSDDAQEQVITAPEQILDAISTQRQNLVADLDENITASSTRSKRSKQPKAEIIAATPTQTRRSFNISFVPETPGISETTMSSIYEPIESAILDAHNVQENAEHVEVSTVVIDENIPNEKTENAKEISSTPVKLDVVTELSEATGSTVNRSTKRKRPDLNIETPVAAKRTPKRLNENVVQIAKLKTEAPETILIPKVEEIQEQNNEVIVRLVEDKSNAIEEVDSVDKVEKKIFDEIFDQVEAGLAEMHEELVVSTPTVNVELTRKSTRGSTVTRSSRHKPIAEGQEATVKHASQNVDKCVVKLTPLRYEVVLDLEEEVAARQIPEETNDDATPSTSKTITTKRGRARTATKTETTIASQTKSNVDDLVAAVLGENLNEKTDQNDSDSNPKKSNRVSTPIPARKRRGRMASTISTLAVESNDDKYEKNESNVETEENAFKSVGNAASERLSRHRKLEEIVPQQTLKEKTPAAGTPLNKRNRNLMAEISENTAPSTSESTTDVVVDEQKSTKGKVDTITAPAKTTRRKRANTEVDNPDENTPKKMKTHLDHVTSEAPATPISFRSLRNRVIVTDEIGTANTPKRARQPRKLPAKDNKQNEPTGTKVVEQQQQPEKSAETAEKPKRKPGRKAKATVEETKENVADTTESVAETKENTEKATQSTSQPAKESKSKRVTKRTKVKSEEPSPADEVKTTEEVPVKAGRRTRKNSQIQTQARPIVSIEIPDDSSEQPTSVQESNEQPANEQQIEKKTRRGRPRKAIVEENEPEQEETVSIEVPSEPPTKKRAVRGKAASKSKKNAGQEEAAKKSDEPVEDAHKIRGKRTRKAEVEAIDNEIEDPQPASKRTRNTKKTNVVEPEEESKPKESVAEKKTRKTKQAVESNDTASISTRPISTRTRRNK